MRTSVFVPLLLATAGGVLAEFSKDRKNHIAVYWGQNSAGHKSGNVTKQDRLATYCESDIDILIISFILDPTTGPSMVRPLLEAVTSPVTSFENFANQDANCKPGQGGYLACPDIGKDISACQQKNKTILLSIGGAVGSNIKFNSSANAKEAAENMWGMFGPKTDKFKDKRPFGDATVDGIDLDIESATPLLEDFAARLREVMPKDALLTAAPQCPKEQDPMNNLTNSVALDMVFVQYYNQERACNLLDEGTMNFKTWEEWAAGTKNKTKWFVGMVAAESAGISGYIAPDKAVKVAKNATGNANFGGVMLWDASQSWDNKVNGKRYDQHLFEGLNAK